MKLNIGSHFEKRNGYINLDNDKKTNPDIVADALKMPFKDNSFREVLMDNLIEHITDTTSLMKEIHRISDRGAIVKVITPHFSNLNFWNTPDHVKPFGYHAFDKFYKNVYNHYGFQLKV